MKKIFLWLLGTVACYQVSAQAKLIIVDNYWDGDIYEAQQNGLGLQKVTEFPIKNRGGYPISFFEHSGSYYGVSDYYGNYDNGTIFRYEYGADSVTVLYDFVDMSPTELVAGPNNTLYGTSASGELFSYHLSSNTFANLGKFGGTGTYQQLMLASNGKIYGTTRSGGTNDEGIVFEFNPSTNAITILHNFNAAADGHNVRRRLTEASDGLLYGVARNGGANGNGTLFSIDPSDGTFAVRYDFDYSTSGRFPYTDLVEATNGLLYGVVDQTTTGSGAFYAFDPTTNQIVSNIVYDASTHGDNFLQLSMINGNLYGMGESSGPNGRGALVKYHINADSLSLVYAFDNIYDWGEGTLLPGQNNELIYASSDGNYSNEGAIVTIDTVTQQAEIQVVFNQYPAGRDPDKALMQTHNNRFFGITEDGGQYDGGTIYEYLPNTNEIVSRYSFNYDSLYPQSYYLAEGPDGSLYGSVRYDGNGSNIASRIDPLFAVGGGTTTPSTDARYLFSFNPDTYELDTLLNFSTVDGDNLGSKLTFDGDNMYGVVTQEGTSSWGGVFSYNLQSGQYELLFSFDPTVGYGPSKVEIANGSLYGITRSGGVNSRGTVYKYDLVNDQLSVIKDFTTSELNGSDFGLILHSNGKLYAELERYPGGLLEIDPLTDAVTQQVAFGNYNLRENNQGHISEGVDGRIYGTVGRLSGSGRGLYAYDPATDTFTDLFAPSYVQGINNFQALAVCIAPLAIQPEDVVYCAGQSLSVALNSQNTTSYIWKKDGQVISEQTGDQLFLDSVTSTDAGIYTAIMTNACGVDSVSFTLTISEVKLEATAIDIKCNGTSEGSISVTASSGTEPYEYSLDGTAFQSEAVFAGLAAGDYTITVRDANGCLASVEATITQPEVLSLSTTSKDETCELGFIIINALGGIRPYEYSLDGTSYQDESQLNNIAAGEYTVYVRDANGCVASQPHTVGLVAALVVNSTVTESTEYPENGSIALEVIGGATPYTYVWNTGDTTATIVDLAPNDYAVTITDKNGCTLEESFTVGGVTSLGDLQRRQGIHIYPNPVVEQLQIRLPANTQIKSAKLISQQGELLRSFRLNGGLNQLKAEGLKPGICLLQLDNGVSTRIVIKK